MEKNWEKSILFLCGGGKWGDFFSKNKKLDNKKLKGRSGSTVFTRHVYRNIKQISRQVEKLSNLFCFSQKKNPRKK